MFFLALVYMLRPSCALQILRTASSTSSSSSSSSSSSLLPGRRLSEFRHDKFHIGPSASSSSFAGLRPRRTMSLSSFHPASSLSPEQFTSSDTFYALSVPARKTGEILKLHKAELLNRPKVRNVVTDEVRGSTPSRKYQHTTLTTISTVRQKPASPHPQKPLPLGHPVFYRSFSPDQPLPPAPRPPLRISLRRQAVNVFSRYDLRRPHCRSSPQSRYSPLGD